MKKLLLTIALLATSAYGQISAPDCISSFTLSAAGSSSGFANQGCIFWNFTYKNYGFSGLSLTLQQAPDANNTPGAWATFQGTGEIGSNPATSTTGAYYTIIASDTNLAAWVRITLSGTTGTGFVTGFIYGYKTYPGASGGGGGGGGCTAPCVVVGPTAVGSPSANAPVQISEQDGSDNLIIPTLGTKSAAISLTSVTGENQIVALSGSTVIRIAHITVAMSTAATVSIDVGTGTNCAGGTTTIWGPFPSNTTGFALDLEPSMLKAPAGDAVCLNFGDTVTAGGGITFAQY